MTKPAMFWMVKGDGPAVVSHESRAVAESEAERLARLNPGIHMPRWASRLTLHVTDVRVQRLQDISEDDAQAEGCPCQGDDDLCGMEAAGWFRDLWDSLNAERAPWAGNPWVVAVTFSPMLGNIDAVAA